MMKPRRVEFVSSKPFAVHDNMEKSAPSIRLCLKLGSTTTTSFPEFSYAELLQNAMDEIENPFAAKEREERDKMVDIAKHFEAKYNKRNNTWEKGQKTEKRRERDEDMIDMGAGYDLSDSFVDDSELYDELVPQCCTPQHGGFYINTGKLEMIVSDDSDSDLFDPQLIKRKRKKMSLNWIDDSQDKNTDVTPATSDDGLAKKKKRLNSVENGLVAGESATGREDFFVKTHDLDPTTWSDLELSSSSDEEAGNSSELSNKVYATSQGMDDAIESVLQQSIHYVSKYSSRLSPNEDAEDGNGRIVVNNRSPDVKAVLAKRLASVEDSVVSSPDVRQVTSADETNGQPLEADNKRFPPALPDNLPASLVSAMDKLKEAAAQRLEGKCKFFTPYVNSLLLEVENQRVRLPRGAKMVIYDYLESFLPCGKMTLIKRSKALRENCVQQTVTDSLKRLKEAIEKVMPEQLVQYDAKIAAANAAYQNKLKVAAASEGRTGNESITQIKAPNRKFIFTDEIKRLLEDIVQGWMDSYTCNSSSGEGQTAEEYLTDCIRTHLIKLWPSQWMRIKIIYNLTQQVHHRWTGNGKQDGEADKVMKKRGRQLKSVSSENQNVGKLMVKKIEREMENEKSAGVNAATSSTSDASIKSDLKDASLAQGVSVSLIATKPDYQSTDAAESDLRELTVTGLASTIDFVSMTELEQSLSVRSNSAVSELDKLAETLRSLSDDFPADCQQQQPGMKRTAHPNKLSLNPTSAHCTNIQQPSTAASDTGSQVLGGRIGCISAGSLTNQIFHKQLTQHSDHLSEATQHSMLPITTSSSILPNLVSKANFSQLKKRQLSHLQIPTSTVQHQTGMSTDVTGSSAQSPLTGTGYTAAHAALSPASVAVFDTSACNNVRRSLPLGSSKTVQQSGSLNDAIDAVIGQGLAADRQTNVTATSRSPQSAVLNASINVMQINSYQQSPLSLPSQQQLPLGTDLNTAAYSISRKSSTQVAPDFATSKVSMQQTNNMAAMSTEMLNQYLATTQQQQQIQKLQAPWLTVQESPPRHQQRSPIASSSTSMVGTHGGSVLTNRRPSMSTSDSIAYLHTFQDPSMAQLHYQNSTDMYLASSGVSPTRSTNRLPTYVPTSAELRMPSGSNMYVPGNSELLFDRSLSSTFKPTDQQNNYAQLQAALATQQAMLQSPHGLSLSRSRYDSPF